MSPPRRRRVIWASNGVCLSDAGERPDPPTRRRADARRALKLLVIAASALDVEGRLQVLSPAWVRTHVRLRTRSREHAGNTTPEHVDHLDRNTTGNTRIDIAGPSQLSNRRSTR